MNERNKKVAAALGGKIDESKLEKIRSRIAASQGDADCVFDAVIELADLLIQMEQDALGAARAANDVSARPRPDAVIRDQVSLADQELDELRHVFNEILTVAPELLTNEAIAEKLHRFSTSAVAKMAMWARRKATLLEQDQKLTETYHGDYQTQLYGLLQSVIRTEGSKGLFSKAGAVPAFMPPIADMTEAGDIRVQTQIVGAFNEAFDILKKEKSPVAGDAKTFSMMVAYRMAGGKADKLPGYLEPIPDVAAAVAAKIEGIHRELFVASEAAGVPRTWLDDRMKRKPINTAALMTDDARMQYFSERLRESLDPKEHVFVNDPEAFETYIEGWANNARRFHNPSMTTQGGRYGTQGYERKWTFKDADAEFSFYEEFGEGTWMDQIIGDARNLAKNVAAAEVWGTGGLDNLRHHWDRSMNNALQGGMDRRVADQLQDEFNQRWKAIRYEYNDPTAPNAAAFLQGLQNYSRSMLGGMVAFSAGHDMARVFDYARRGAAKGAYKNAPVLTKTSSKVQNLTVELGGFWSTLNNQLKQFAQTEEGQRYLTEVAKGWELHHLIAAGRGMSKYGYDSNPALRSDNPLLKPLAKKWLETSEHAGRFLDKINLQELGHNYLTNMMIGLTDLEWNNHLRLFSWADMKRESPVMFDRMSRFGIDSTDWAKLQKLWQKKHDPKTLRLDPDDLRLADIRLYHRFQALMLSEAHTALGVPDALTRSYMSLQRDPASGIGMLARTTLGFKSFIAHSYRVTSPRTYRELKLLGRSKLGVMRHAISSAFILAVGGAVTANLKEVIAGREPWELSDWQLWMKGTSYSSYPGFLADVYLQAYQQKGEFDPDLLFREMGEQGAIDILGPSGAMVTNFGTALWKGADHLIDTDNELHMEKLRDAKVAVDSTLRMTPLAYHFATKPVVNYMMQDWYFDRNPRAMLDYKRRQENLGKGD